MEKNNSGLGPARRFGDFDKEEMSDHLKLTILSTLMGLTLFSNICSILALIGRKSSSGGNLTRMYFFLLHLFIADIIVAFSSLLPEIIILSVTGGKHFIGGNWFCKLIKYIQMFGPYLW